MTENELRIGNWISLHGKIIQIDGIAMGCINPFWATGEVFDDGFVLDAQPIPLDESWLIRAGFEKHDTEWRLCPCAEIQIIVFNEGAYNGVMFYTRTIHTDYTPIYCGKHINYIHQLQNLYFALTGTELTFKDL